MIYRIFFCSILISLLSNCGGNKATVASRESDTKQASRYHLAEDAHPLQHEIPDLKKVNNAVPKLEPKSRQGNPKQYTVNNKTYNVLPHSNGFKETGHASWYGKKFHGHKTSNGEIYDMYAMTAAHKSLPLPTYLKVKNLHNNRQIVVRVNDRGPFHDNRIIDLSYAAATKLGILGKGTAKVEIAAINHGEILATQKQVPGYNDVELPQSSAPQPKAIANSAAANPTATTNTTKYYIQLGAFGQKLNAQKFSEKLKQQLELAPHIEESTEQASAFYRVKLGPFANQAEAQTAISKLRLANITANMIVIPDHTLPVGRG